MQKLLPWHVKASMDASILAKLPRMPLRKEVALELGEGGGSASIELL
jgi:tRNA1(Val) A37 N6-methylase TrmN6